MKYKAINKNIIVHHPDETTTDSGIIVKNEDGAVKTVQVVATNDLTKDLQNKTVFIHARHFNAGKLDSEYASVSYEDVLAYE